MSEAPIPFPGRARRAAAWGVHLLTASSAPAGLLAMRATVQGDAATAFLWMAYTLAVDAIDGTLARAVRVKEVIPWVDGSRLDDVVDYFTYVLVPAFFLLQMNLLPAGWAMPVLALVADRERVRLQPGGGRRRPTTSSPASRRTGTSSRSTSTCSAGRRR